jgi:hypothetical protein
MDDARVADAPNALYFAVLATATFFGVLIEQAIPDERRHHERQPAGLALLVAALAVAWSHYAVLRVGLRRDPRFVLPLAIDTLFILGVVALYGASVAFLDCYFAEPSAALYFFAMLRRLPGHRWHVQSLLIGAALFIPAWAWYIFVNDFKEAFGYVANFALFPVLVAAHRYASVRGDCEEYAAAAVVGLRLAEAEERSTALGRLMTGVLPPHVAGRVDLSEARPLMAAEPEEFQRWNNLSVLQVVLRFDTAAPRILRCAWHEILAAIHDVGAEVLEMVQAMGDTFLVAGPFVTNADEARCVAAARCCMLLLGTLRRDLEGTCGLSAIATAGSAAGALMGSSLLTYRLFGPAVRECEALLAAAPVPVDPRRCVAFVSEAFRRQESNYGCITFKRGADVNAAMSLAIHSTCAVPEAPTREDATRKPDMTEMTSAFGEPLLWRVRGVGATVVSAVVFAPPPTNIRNQSE